MSRKIYHRILREIRHKRYKTSVLIILLFSMILIIICIMSNCSAEDLYVTKTMVATSNVDNVDSVDISNDEIVALGEGYTTDENVQEDFENEKIEQALLAKAHKIDNCMITHYCNEKYPHICGNGDGKTCTGNDVVPYVTCAVDKNVIPYGSDVLVDYGDGEIYYYKADDCGGWINGNHIDLAVQYHDEAQKLGIKYATVYWIGPEEE